MFEKDIFLLKQLLSCISFSFFLKQFKVMNANKTKYVDKVGEKHN